MLATLLWLPILLCLSYGIISGLTPLATTNFRMVEWVALGGFLLFIALNYAIAKGLSIVAKRFIETDDLTSPPEKD